MFYPSHWPEIADRLRLCHKYGMLKIRSAQEKSLMPSLMEFTSETAVSTDQYNHYNMVPVIASAAEEYGCKDMLRLCEAFVVQYFDVYASCPFQQLMSKLPLASMIRICLGLAKTHKDTMSAVRKALDASVSEVKECSLKCDSESKCPRCGKALQPMISRRPDGTTPPSIPRHKVHPNRCKWPDEHTFTAPNPKVADVAKYIASLENNN